MKNIVASLLLLAALSAFGQDEKIGQKIDELTKAWDAEAAKMSTYKGLSEFCQSEAYRSKIISNLKGIHHYDSVLYDRLTKKARFSNDSEIKKTIKDIEAFEKDYSIKSFLAYLKKECGVRSEIEKDKKKTGGEEYDSQVYMLELELGKFVKQLTKRIDTLREHVHHLHVE
jgi:hypothetical protein